MIPINPALELYQHWREPIRWQQEHGVNLLRFPKENSRWHSPSTFVDQNFTVSVDKVTDVHLNQADVLHLITPDMLEPVITLRAHRQNNNVLTLWPDGSFQLCNRYWYLRHHLENQTFLRRSWAIRDQVTFVESAKTRWCYVDARNFNRRQPYLPTDAMQSSVRYELEFDLRTRSWKVAVSRHEPVNHRRVSAQLMLERGYAAANVRYDRFERRQNNRTAISCDTGDQVQVQDVQKHLVIYNAPRPKEAVTYG